MVSLSLDLAIIGGEIVINTKLHFTIVYREEVALGMLDINIYAWQLFCDCI